MNRSTYFRILAFVVAFVAIQLTAKAGGPDPVYAAATPEKVEIQDSPKTVVAEKAVVETDLGVPAAATTVILGLTLLLLIPVGIEWLAPHSVEQLFSSRRTFMQKRVSP